MKTYTSKSLADTKKIAADWLESISAGDSVSSVGMSAEKTNLIATIVGLSGDLGSGKTTFTQAIAQELGITEFVTSPTFVIMKMYPTKHSVFKKLIHIDAYRFEKPEELAVLNFDKLTTDPNNLILIEWPEKVSKGLLKGLKMITFKVVGEGERSITIA